MRLKKVHWLCGVLALGLSISNVVPAAENAPLAMSISAEFADALRRADAERIQKMLADSPAQLEARDVLGWTPLMHATFYADASCLELLLKQGADAKAVSGAGATALHFAATDLDKVRLLLKAGADANAASAIGNTPLMIAARSSRSAPVVRLLLDHRAEVNARNLFGVTALMIASSAGDMETVKLLLDRGADVSLAPYAKPRAPDGTEIDLVFGGGLTALGWAVHDGRLEIATLLIDAGADVNQQAPFGTPLVKAAQMNRPRLAKLLLDRGADVNAVAEGWTPLMWAAANECGDVELAELLIKRRADVNATGGEEWGPQMSVPHSALMIAERRGETPLVAFLRRAGAKELPDPWARKVCNPPARDISAEQVDAAAILAAVQAAIPLLERTAVDSAKEFIAHGQQCISCHNQLLPLIAVSTAKSRGVPYDKQALMDMLRMAAPPDGAGLPFAAEVTFHPSATIMVGYTQWGLALESVPRHFMADASVQIAAAHQREDGSWREMFSRPPIVDGDIPPTALAIRSLTLAQMPGRKAEMDERVARARDWLRKSKPRVTEEHVYKLLGLHWAGEPRDKLATLVDELAGLQRDDGGWGQVPGLASDAYATGQALYALYDAGGRTLEDLVFRKGVACLLRTQMEDGSWFVRRRAYPFQPTMDPKFPHGRDAWISAAATSWAVMALSVSLDKKDVTELLADGSRATPPAKVAPAKELPPAAKKAVDYKKDILPIFEKSCVGCHTGKDAAGSYAIDTRSQLIKGGFSGPPVVVPGDSTHSLLIRHVAGLIEDVEMPPLDRRDDYEPLSREEIGLLRAWIDRKLPGMDD